MALLPALIGCAVLPQAAPGATPALRQPNGKWVLDYGETACTAYRNFGSKESPVVLAFRPSPNGSVVRLSLVRDGRVAVPHHFPVTTNISESSVKTTGLRFASADRKGEIIWINFARPQLEGLSRAGEIAITGGRTLNERFALPGMAGVLKALDTCNSNLRAYWNIGDSASVIATAAAPAKSPAHWVSSGDYPKQAFDENASGIVQFVLLIDETGKTRDCMVEDTSGVASLDAMACVILRERARFKPALDVGGKPVRSSWTSRVRWIMR
ncbi:MAG: energy transducer TonB [Pseudomonadota bacterium]|nr:energy transducer TonB [Pseudomonadota bacterium]